MKQSARRLITSSTHMSTCARVTSQSSQVLSFYQVNLIAEARFNQNVSASSKKEDFLKTQSKRKDQSEQFVDDDPDSKAENEDKEEVPEEIRRMQRRKYR